MKNRISANISSASERPSARCYLCTYIHMHMHMQICMYVSLKKYFLNIGGIKHEIYDLNDIEKRMYVCMCWLENASKQSLRERLYYKLLVFNKLCASIFAIASCIKFINSNKVYKYIHMCVHNQMHDFLQVCVKISA